MVVFAAAVAWAMRSSAASRLERPSWVLYAALAFLLAETMWGEDWGFLRELSEFYILGVIILLGSPSKIKICGFSLSFTDTGLRRLWSSLVVLFFAIHRHRTSYATRANAPVYVPVLITMSRSVGAAR